MSRRTARTSPALGFFAGGLLFASESRADDVNRVASTPPAHVVAAEPAPATDPPVGIRVAESAGGLDVREIGGVVLTVGASYGVALCVAGMSGPRGDGAQDPPVAPMVGPWFYFVGPRSCLKTESCDGEATSRARFVANGIAQAFDALSAFSGLVFSTTNELKTTTTTATARTFQVTPERYAQGGLGLAAVARF